MKLSDAIILKGDREILDLETTGKAVHALKPFYDNRTSQSISYVIIPQLDLTLCKIVRYIFIKHNTKTFPHLNEAKTALRELGIPFSIVNLRGGERVELVIDAGIYLSSFSTSSDPEVWKKRQEAEVRRRKLKAVEAKLDGR